MHIVRKRKKINSEISDRLRMRKTVESAPYRVVRMGGWVVIKSVLRFSLFSSMLTSKMRWFQKWCQKLSTAFLSKVMNTLKFQNSTNEDRVPIWKIAQKIYWRKLRLSPAESYWSFPKKFQSKKCDIKSKLWKILKVQNMTSKALQKL